MDLFLPTFLFLFGCIWGSFVNVLIYRIPEGVDFFSPPSRCMKCGHKINPWENIPILSYVFLRGRCSHCKTKLSWQYPLIELLCGLFLFFQAELLYAPDGIVKLGLLFAIFCCLIVHFVIDMRYMILPDLVSLVLLFACFHYTLFFGQMIQGLQGSFLGLFIPGMLALFYYFYKGVEGLGIGDIKLYAIIGLVLGPMGLLQTLFFSAFFGSLLAGTLIVLKVIDRKTPIPFGPFIIVVFGLQFFLPQFWAKIINAVLPL